MMREKSEGGRMTELMKRYEGERVEKDVIKYFEDMSPKQQVVRAFYVHCLFKEFKKLEAINKWLEDQLTWRPVSEKPEKSCKCIGKFDDGEMYDDLVYYDAKNDLWSRQVQNCFESWKTSYMPPIKYFIIPPAPEGEIK